MMQAEKVVGDLRDAQDSVSGDGSPLSTLSAALRRLERRQPQAPALVDPSLKALDAALTALDLAQQTLDQALRDARIRPAPAGAGRGAAVRAARRLPQICRAGRQPCRRWRKNSPPISPRSTPARRGSSPWQGAGCGRERIIDRAPPTLTKARLKAAVAELDAAVNGRACRL